MNIKVGIAFVRMLFVPAGRKVSLSGESMDPLDKLELILSSMIEKNKNDIKRGMGQGMNPSFPYLKGVRKYIDGLEEALALIRQVKRNTPNMSDEVVLKMYGPKQ